MTDALTDYRRKFLVVLDGSKDAIRAAIFAGYRVRRTGGTLKLLTIIETQDFGQFLGVEDVMRAEAREAAEALLDAARVRLSDLGDIRIETLIREGDLREAVEAVIAEDRAIGILVLAASTSKEAPGTLITDFVARSGAGTLPVIVTIVPGSMSEAEIIAAT
jgi:nucleotide-binding universal stress UspA family protein